MGWHGLRTIAEASWIVSCRLQGVKIIFVITIKGWIWWHDNRLSKTFLPCKLWCENKLYIRTKTNCVQEPRTITFYRHPLYELKLSSALSTSHSRQGIPKPKTNHKNNSHINISTSQSSTCSRSFLALINIAIGFLVVINIIIYKFPTHMDERGQFFFFFCLVSSLFYIIIHKEPFHIPCSIFKREIHVQSSWKKAEKQR